MSPSLVSPSDLKLDLVFIPISLETFRGPLNLRTRMRVTESILWEKDLMTWIKDVRMNNTLLCPESVRRASSLSIGLQLTDDITIQELNEMWRQNPEKTDVLSFPILDEKLPLPDQECVELGDIVVSVTRAEFQAIEQKHDLETELRWLVCHGLLHLLGWDHPNSKSLKKMLTYQEHLLSINGNVHNLGDSTELTKDAP